MLAHVFNAGVRALAASLFFGGVLIYAVGGIDSPDARPLAGVIAVSFFMFWIVFVFLFGPRVPKSDGRGTQTEVEGGPCHGPEDASVSTANAATGTATLVTVAAAIAVATEIRHPTVARRAFERILVTGAAKG